MAKQTSQGRHIKWCQDESVEEIREEGGGDPVVKVKVARSRHSVEQGVATYTVGITHEILFLCWHFFQITVYFWLVSRDSRVIICKMFESFSSEEQILLVGVSLYPGIPTWKYNVSIICKVMWEKSVWRENK